MVHLKQFTTTEEDHKNKQRRDPQFQPIEVDTSVFRKLEDGNFLYTHEFIHINRGQEEASKIQEDLVSTVPVAGYLEDYH